MIILQETQLLYEARQTPSITNVYVLESITSSSGGGALL
jgi:hypothetical protein